MGSCDVCVISMIHRPNTNDLAYLGIKYITELVVHALTLRIIKACIRIVLDQNQRLSEFINSRYTCFK